MTIKTENWLGEYTSTIGTGDITLGGAIDGFAGFSNVGENVDVYYTVMDALDKETGIGTLTGGKLVRKDIHATLVDGAYVKNGSAINLSGDAQVYGTANAHFLDYVQAVANAEIVNTQAIAELKALQINGHALTASFNLTAADVGAHPDSWMPSTEALNVYQKAASDIRYLKTQDAEQVAGLVMRVGGEREQQLQQSINDLSTALCVGAKIYRGSNSQYVQNGDTVPSGTTHLIVLINGKAENVAMSPIASGVVSLLTETGATIGGTPVKFTLIRELQFSSIEELKTPPINPSMLDSFDLPAKTTSYHGGWAAMLKPSGGAEYVLTTLQKVRDTYDDATWVPDGYGDHYLFGGSTYVAMLVNDGVANIRKFGSVSDASIRNGTGTDNTPNLHAAINYAAYHAIPVYAPSGEYRFLGTLQWKPSSQDWSTGTRGILFYGDDIATTVFLGNNHNMIDLGLVSGNFKCTNMSFYGSAANFAIEFTGRGLFNSDSVGEVHCTLYKVNMQYFGTAVDGGVGTWVSHVDSCKFYFNEVGLFLNANYAGHVVGCDFASKVNIRSNASLVQMAIERNHFGLGTPSAVMGGSEICLDLAIEGISIKNNYFEAYDNPADGCTVLRLSINQQDRSIIEGNYINVGSRHNMVLRELRVQNGFPSTMLTNTEFKLNRIIASESTSKTWFNTDDLTTNIITYKFDDVRCTKDSTKVKAVNFYTVPLFYGFTYTHGTSGTLLDLNDFVKYTNDLRMTDLITPTGSLHLQAGTYKFSYSSRAVAIGPASGKRVRVKMQSTGGKIFYLTLIPGSGDIEPTVGAFAFNSAAEDWTFTVVPYGYLSGEQFQEFGLTISLELVSPSFGFV